MRGDHRPSGGGEPVTSYHLAKTGKGWAVMDNTGGLHGIQPTRSDGQKLLQIVRHMALSRMGFTTWS